MLTKIELIKQHQNCEYQSCPSAPKIVIESDVLPDLARFVTAEAIALHLELDLQQIKEIRCWRYVMLVVAQGITTFVSYADLPPILGVAAPTGKDMLVWRKRWKQHAQKAPEFWVNFYAGKFRQSRTAAEMDRWGQLVKAIKFGLTQAAVQCLNSFYAAEKYTFGHF